MPFSIQPGEKITITSTLVNADISGDEVIIEPDSVSGTVSIWNSTTSVYDLVGSFTPVEESSGVYSYEWTPATDGRYRVEFEAEVPIDNTITDTRIFYVGTAEPEETLGVDRQFFFLGELDPMYVDPARILEFYPDGNIIEIAMKIHRYSLEVQRMVSGDKLNPVHPLVEQYIVAAVLCELSRIYVYGGGLGGFSQSDMFRLGDLQVQSGSGSGQNGSGNAAGGPGTWCELAAQLREDLIYGSAGMRSVYKARTDCTNHFATRELKCFD